MLCILCKSKGFRSCDKSVCSTVILCDPFIVSAIVGIFEQNKVFINFVYRQYSKHFYFRKVFSFVFCLELQLSNIAPHGVLIELSFCGSQK